MWRRALPKSGTAARVESTLQAKRKEGLDCFHSAKARNVAAQSRLRVTRATSIRQDCSEEGGKEDRTAASDPR